MTRTLFGAAAALALFVGTSSSASAQFFYPAAPVGGLGVAPGGYYSGYNPYRGTSVYATPFGVTQYGSTPFGGSYVRQSGFNPYTGANYYGKSYYNPYTGASGYRTGFYNPLFNTYGYQYRYFR